ncbi:PC-esterase domain-containing protein 1A-like isoform X2 [Oratosquilla oratoria]|uniref:PC-esterase domain-containing protein 1A-like isoform X2 n=1 Tax=Oratosquilla oratoria TaxID=337810 RepID=UPI003F771C24
MDIFLSHHAQDLLRGKLIIFFGDSNMRSFYKDLIYLITKNNVAPPPTFRRRANAGRYVSFHGDKVIDLSKNSTNGRDYYEVREYKENDIHIRFNFITRVYYERVIEELKKIETGEIPAPDIVVINSCLWDLTRWGALRESKYKEEMAELFSHLKRLLPEDTLIIWTTTLPVASSKVKGGVFIKQIEFIKHSMRFVIMEANRLAQQMCIAFQVDLLDLHYHMRFQLHSRTNDGLHWETHAIRHITNLLLTHIALALDFPLPGKISNNNGYLKAAKQLAQEASEGKQVEIVMDHEVKEMMSMKRKAINRVIRSTVKVELKKKPEENNNSNVRKKVQAKRRLPVTSDTGSNKDASSGGQATIKAGSSQVPSIQVTVSGKNGDNDSKRQCSYSGKPTSTGPTSGAGNSMQMPNRNHPRPQNPRVQRWSYGVPPSNMNWNSVFRQAQPFWHDYPTSNFPWNR